ncbi:hypothetical protein [Gordonia soli]|uniref:Uncharacterized protein n=1 Tax=Gordonia soli NBRC 108243 TaxID=1223545 RepID=M0QP36_9ACTN|nr:hypothetical protein [Gordonia soli]GAC69207.1 hypothetical protein GS4_23_00010 [Gordonia soli NBRC 108243]
MFGRANSAGSAVAAYATSVAKALSDAAEPIGTARTNLLTKADEIELGDLHVTNAWVVLIKPIPMTAEKAEKLQKDAIAAQSVVNGLLLAVGDADDAAAASVQTAAEGHGFVLKNPTIPFLPGAIKPSDEVPNPRFPTGLMQQSLVRSEDMGVTVRETTKHEDKEGNRVTTIHMQDGSKQVTMEMNPYRGPVATQRVNEVQVSHIDKDGKPISKTVSWEEFTGTKVTSTTWADGTNLYAQEWPDGYSEARVTTADGRSGLVPKDSPFFTHPVATSVGGAMSGIDEYAKRGGGIPSVSADDVKKIGVGAKFAGPAIGIGTAIYDVAAAGEGEKCAAAISGAFGVGGSALGGWGGAGLGALGGAGVGSVPLAIGGAATGAVAGSWVGGWVGSKVAGVVCP